MDGVPSPPNTEPATQIRKNRERQDHALLLLRFGISWQVVPSILPELMAGDAEKSNPVMRALWSMVKLDIGALQQAAEV